MRAVKFPLIGQTSYYTAGTLKALFIVFIRQIKPFYRTLTASRLYISQHGKTPGRRVCMRPGRTPFMRQGARINGSGRVFRQSPPPVTDNCSMDFDQIETFLEVARHFSFSRAAEKRF